MSIWISEAHLRNGVLGVAIVAVLASCGSRRFGAVSRTKAQRTTIMVSSREMVIQGPPGFCVDNDITEIQGDNAFVLLGNCAAVSPPVRSVQPEIKALLTASVSGSGQGVATIRESAVSMDSFFRSETGRTALSRNSDPGTVQVLDTFHKDDTFFIRARDTSEGLAPGVSDDYWRAYFDLNDQIVSVSVIGFTDDPLAADKGLETLQNFANTLRANNGGTTVTAPPPVVKIKRRDTLKSVGILRRLFF